MLSREPNISLPWSEGMLGVLWFYNVSSLRDFRSEQPTTLICCENFRDTILAGFSNNSAPSKRADGE